MNHTVAASIEYPDSMRLPPVYCAIPRLTYVEADTVIAALETIIHALIEARFPDPAPEDLVVDRTDQAPDEIPF